jgi:hypothetical protein
VPFLLDQRLERHPRLRRSSDPATMGAKADKVVALPQHLPQIVEKRRIGSISTGQTGARSRA